MQILAGDIGGTHTRLALYRASSATRLELVTEQTYSSQAHESIETILQRFLDQPITQPIERACLGLAGPVIDQTCDTTNLPWRVSAAEIRRRFGFKDSWLLNDLEANAWGIEMLSEADLFTLNPGSATAVGNRSIISAGTGLGEAGLYWNGQSHCPFPSEGGHTDFSPTDALEFALFEKLSNRYGHVSWERLVSGPGLETLHAFLRSYRGIDTPEWLRQEMNRIGAAPAIANAGMEKSDPLCRESVERFVRLYAREAGNHALNIMATGGVYLGGGIAPRILPLLRDDGFMPTFLAKGRMRHIMQAMPVSVILNDKAALIGAAHYARLQ
ncbi:MAG: glucokinase [Candidatus Thiodiazotropha sp. (ex Epidulcina cf. delphinae)]|nr:glucokinase [Candidatus Thiodiazotropha sp. (ex Epidulcina cf. delphinae)]